MSSDEVAFHLGMPIETRGEAVIYMGGKPNGVITGIFKNNRLASLNCDPAADENKRRD
jgi:hypothetical protein